MYDDDIPDSCTSVYITLLPLGYCLNTQHACIFCRLCVTGFKRTVDSEIQMEKETIGLKRDRLGER